MSINCPGCKVENKDGAKFCKGCGCSFTNLVACPSCTSLTKAGKFCVSCGHSFVSQAPADVVSATETAKSTTQQEQILEGSQLGGAEAPVASPTTVDLGSAVAPESKMHEPAEAVQHVQFLPSQESSQPQTPQPLPADVLSGSSAANFEPSKDYAQPRSQFKALYVAIALVAIVALGCAYWLNNEKVGEQLSATPEVTLPTEESIVTPATEVEPATDIAVATAKDEVQQVDTVEQPLVASLPPVKDESTQKPAFVAKPAPVVSVAKQDADRMPVNAAKPAQRSSAASYAQSQTAAPAPVVGSWQPAQPARMGDAPETAPVKTLDQAYDDRITAECPRGFFPGMACREKVRWQMCDGKWSSQPNEGQQTCKSSK